jgi:hypothetical protein
MGLGRAVLVLARLLAPVKRELSFQLTTAQGNTPSCATHSARFQE